MSIFDRFRQFGPKSPPDTEPYHYPLDRTNDRRYAPDYQGVIYTWDIDKTYLASDFDSLRGLISIPFELAVDKRQIAGTGPLLHALRRGTEKEGTAQNPIYFISASPPQLRSVIEKKMVLDGVEYDGLTFKDHVRLIRSRRVSRVTEQIGYKLSALLLNRHELPWQVREVFFGDDSESDALIYALYGDIVAGRLRHDDLRRTLKHNGVDEQDVDYVSGLAADLPQRELVHRIYINLAKGSPPKDFEGFGPRLIACNSSLQMSLHLQQDGFIDTAAVVAVANELVHRHQQQPSELIASALSLVERGCLSPQALALNWRALQRAELFPSYLSIEDSPKQDAQSNVSGAFITPSQHLAVT